MLEIARQESRPESESVKTEEGNGGKALWKAKTSVGLEVLRAPYKLQAFLTDFKSI